MKIIYTKNEVLKNLLFELLEKTNSTYIDMYDREWCITFAQGDYGTPNTAVCELIGSPVKRTVLIRLNSNIAEFGAVVIGACFGFCKKIRTARFPELLAELQTELRKEQS